MGGVADHLRRVRGFLAERSWAAELDSLPRWRRIGYHLSRLAYGTYRGIVDRRLTLQAAALTYYSVLAIVPLLAFAFSVLKGFGAYHRLIEGTLRPYLAATFGRNPELLGALDRVLRFVDQTQVSSLGVLGVVFLLYTALGLLSTIESALNQVWGAKSKRTFLRQLTDYTTILVVTPLLAFAAVTVGAAAGSSSVVAFLRDKLSLGPLLHLALKLTSLLLGCATMISLYTLMPNVRTRARSVLIVGLVGGLLWQLVLLLYVRLQSGVAQYNALYATFAAFPIFLVWLYAAWTTVLVGAQVGAVDQHAKRIRYEILPRRIDHALEEMLAIAVAAEVTKRFAAAERPPSKEAIAERLFVDPPGLERILDALVASGVLARVIADHGEPGYAPGQDPDRLRVADIRSAVRYDPRAGDVRRTVERALHPRIGEVLRQSERALRHSDCDISLRELATAIASPAPAAEGAEPEPGSQLH